LDLILFPFFLFISIIELEGRGAPAVGENSLSSVLLQIGEERSLLWELLWTLQKQPILGCF